MNLNVDNDGSIYFEDDYNEDFHIAYLSANDSDSSYNFNIKLFKDIFEKFKDDVYTIEMIGSISFLYNNNDYKNIPIREIIIKYKNKKQNGLYFLVNKKLKSMFVAPTFYGHGIIAKLSKEIPDNWKLLRDPKNFWPANYIFVKDEDYKIKKISFSKTQKKYCLLETDKFPEQMFLFSYHNTDFYKRLNEIFSGKENEKKISLAMEKTKALEFPLAKMKIGTKIEVTFFDNKGQRKNIGNLIPADGDLSFLSFGKYFDKDKYYQCYFQGDYFFIDPKLIFTTGEFNNLSKVSNNTYEGQWYLAHSYVYEYKLGASFHLCFTVEDIEQLKNLYKTIVSEEEYNTTILKFELDNNL